MTTSTTPRSDRASASARVPTPGLLAGFGALLAVLLAALVVGGVNLRRVYGASDAVAHTQAVRAALQALLATAVDAETGQRGYIITGDAAYLGPYDRALASISDHFVRVRALTADNPEQQEDLERLRATVGARMDTIVETLRLRQESGFAAAQARVASGPGRRLMDEMRAIVARMEAREERLLAVRTAQAARSYRVAQIAEMASSALGLLVVLLLFVGTRRLGAERQRSEQTAERLNVTLTSIGDAVITTDDQGRVVRVNHVAEALTGWTESEAAGRRLEEVFVIINEQSRRPAENPIGRVLRERAIVGLANHTILISKDGREIPIDDSAAPIKTADGQFIGVVMVFRDITERREAERDRARLTDSERAARYEAEAAEQRLAIALEAGRLGTWEFLIRTGDLAWSPGLETIHGYAPGTFSGKFEAFEREIHPDDHDRVLGAIREAIEQKRDHHIEYRIVRADGTVRWVEGRGQLFLAEDGRPDRLVGVCSDVTERKLSEEAERRAKREALEANRTKDEFLAMVSHELRTPLNAVLGWAGMLRSGTLPDDRRGRALDAVYSNAMRQTKLIDELLDLSRIMSGKLQLDRAPLDLRAVLRAAMDIVQPAADTKRIRLTAEADDSIDPFYADSARLQQVLGNLLSNAVKFTPDGGAVRVRLRRMDQAIELTVTDTGQGIPAEFLESVFDPFRQTDQLTTRRHGGLGLGLSIVRHLVEAHGGTVRAESAGPGQGSTFVVRLPIVTDEEMDGRAASLSPADSSSIGPAPGRLRGIAVLVVDDDQDSRELLVATLEQCGAAVEAAGSAAHSLEILQRRHVDVLLSDIAMPDEDGYSLIRRVRALEAAGAAHLPAAALTSLAREEDRSEALRAGFQLHLVKPIDPSTLIDTVAALAGGFEP